MISSGDGILAGEFNSLKYAEELAKLIDKNSDPGNNGLLMAQALDQASESMQKVATRGFLYCWLRQKAV